MDENQTHGEYYDDEFGVDLSDILSGSDEAADQPDVDNADGAASGEVSGTENATDDGDAAETADQPDGDANDGAQGKTFHLKWMDEQRDVSEEEIVPLAQKGMDYDRVRGKLDEARAQNAELAKFRDENADTINELREFMEENKLESLSDVLDVMRVMKLTQRGVNKDVALAQVKQGRAERALARATAAQTSQQTAETKLREKVQADLAAFRQAHPDVNLQDVIPKMQDELAKTNDLEKAYLLYENKRERAERARLEKELKAAQQNAENKRRNPGSMKSAGGDKYNGDEFLAGFYSV